MRHAIAMNPAATVNGTGKVDAAVSDPVSVAVVPLVPLLPGEYRQLVPAVSST